MALIPKIKLCLASNCSDLTFYELTGVYNVTTNVGGYGSPNVTTASITSSILTIVAPDTARYAINMLSNGYPTSNTELGFTIDLGDLSRTSIEDGYWQFIYTLIDDSLNVYEVTTSYYFYCNSTCCVAKMLSSIELDDCDCNKENTKKINNYIKAKTFLESLKNAARCFNETNFDSIKTILDKICKNTGCKTCN